MPNIIDDTGIKTETYAETIAALESAFKAIYGSDINLDSNSPDGNLLNILGLSKQDVLALIVQTYASMDPDQAVGAALDALCALCGISRKGGTYTRVTVQVTVNRTTTLVGLDTSSSPYTIADQNGNQFQLLVGQIGLASGAHSLNFQAKNIGAVQVQANTINTPVTIVLGVTTINNLAVPYQQGVDQETDAQIRARRQKSTAGPAHGVKDALYAALNDIPDVINATVYVNNTDSVDANGVDPHSVWCIVDGGSDADIASVIDRYLSAGCGMMGAEEVDVVQADGTSTTIYFDRAIEERLYIRFTAYPLFGGVANPDALAAGIKAQYTLEANQKADTTSIAAICHAIDPTVAIESAGVSKNNSNFYEVLAPTTVQKKFTIAIGDIHIT